MALHLRGRTPQLQGLHMPVDGSPDLQEQVYVDDTMLFCQYAPDTLDRRQSTLSGFSCASGSLINWHKSSGFVAGLDNHYEGDLTQLGLYFVIENNEYGEQVQEELVPGGKDMQVSNDNVIKYIHHVANYRLNIQIRQQSLYFLRGFQQLIQTKWIDMFNEHELQVLISGSVEGLNVDDLRSNANYSGGYSESHPVIEMFWEIMKTLDSGLQQKFLKFVTGCSRGPLLGFKYLEPPFCIQRAAPEDVSDDMLDRLPTSATCMNLLKLPPYKRKDTLKAKLLYAITADAGFDLS
ncbi:hypothetical protein L7F22_063197 [Adiantum nelumboides]|nr:hypothetical protein [Adiantum nelumboides]